MLQITYKEIQAHFDDLFCSINKSQSKAMKKNQLIDALPDGRRKLYSIFGLIQPSGKTEEQLKSDFEQSFQIIEDALKRLNISNSSIVAKNVSKANGVPMLIRQILFFMCYVAYWMEDNAKKKGRIGKSKVTQEYFLDRFGFSHNTWTKWGMRPLQLSQTSAYIQPECPIHYKGQKKGELGFAINNLVYCAGKYDCFLDIFGGSGSASAAVCPIDNKKYLYNEWNPTIYHTIYVLSHEKLHIELIDLLKQIQDDLAEKGHADFLDEFHLYSSKDLIQAIQEREKNGKMKTSTTEKMSKVAKESGLPLVRDWRNLYDFGKEYNQCLRKKLSAGATIQIGKKNYTYDELKFPVDENGNIDVSNYWLDRERQIRIHTLERKWNLQFAGYRLADEEDAVEMGVSIDDDLVNRRWKEELRKEGNVKEFNKLFKDEPFDIKLLSEEQKNKREDEIERLEKRKSNLPEALFDMMHYLILCYWQVFYNLYLSFSPSNDREKVSLAAAHIFLRYMAFQGLDEKSNTRVLYLDDYRSDDYKSALVEKFIQVDYKKLIKDFYKRFRRETLYNKNAIDLVKQYKKGISKEDVIIYSDSPYEGTSGYEKDKTDKFTEKDMKDLIDVLVDSKQKFIFSCRAAKGSLSGSKTDDKLKKLNGSILENVFEVFEEYQKEKKIVLYVLAIERKEGKKVLTLADLIRLNKISEIMICNYKVSYIMPYHDSIHYQVYTFVDFMDIVRKNMNK